MERGGRCRDEGREGEEREGSVEGHRVMGLDDMPTHQGERGTYVNATVAAVSHDVHVMQCTV